MIENYYNVGTVQDIVISHTSMSSILPTQGGSPLKFKMFFEDRKELKGLGIVRGSNFHKWAEAPEIFLVGDADKPADKLGEVADAMVQVFSALEVDKKPMILEFPESMLFDACRAIGWYNNWKEDAIIKNASPSVLPYFREVVKADIEGKTFLTKSNKVSLTNSVLSIKNNKLANELLFYKDEFSNKEYIKEGEFYWEEIIDGTLYKFKCKVDDLEIDHDKKIIRLSDIKTTSKSAYQFLNSFVEYHYGRQHFIYRRGVLANRPELSEYKWEFRNVVVETNNLFQTVVYRFKVSLIDSYKEEFLDGVNRIGLAIENNFTLSFEEVVGNGEIKISELPKGA